MNQAISFSANLQELKTFADKLSVINKPSDIILLQGDIGTGKTTFTRMWINALHYKAGITPPSSIKSPTFPIMISYDLKQYEVYHYDLYRLRNSKELQELDIFENFTKNILIIEWPELLMKELEKKNYYLIKFSFTDSSTRQIELNHSKEKIHI